jgi:proline-specific peptidase
MVRRSKMNKMVSEEGKVYVDGYNVWYRKVGSGATPLLVLHGGPGAGHDYLEPLEALACDRSVVFYDQLGCGNSDRSEDASLWRIERFVTEINRVRSVLGLDRVHLLGHSWGGWLAIEYMLMQPAGVCSLILASTSATVQQFVAEASKLKAALPPAVVKVMQKHEEADTFDHPEYETAVLEFYERHLCRLHPWPESLMRSVRNLEGNPVYATMNGPNEFTVTGNLKNWDRAERLHEISVATLITVGRFDEITPVCAETLHRGIPNSEMVVFEQSSHMAHLEEAEVYVKTVAGFLKRVEKSVRQASSTSP